MISYRYDRATYFVISNEKPGNRKNIIALTFNKTSLKSVKLMTF